MKNQKRKIIDVHAHADFNAHDLKKSIANMDSFGIDQAWILACEIPFDESLPEGNTAGMLGYDNVLPFAIVLEYAQKEPERFILGYAPDPRNPAAQDYLEAAIELYNVKTYGEWKFRMMLDNPDAVRMFRFCGEKKLPVTLHLQDDLGDLGVKYPRASYWYGGNIDALERTLQLCDETIFIGHAMTFWSHISKDEKAYTEYYPEGAVIKGGRLPELLRKYPNINCDMSGGSGLFALQRDTVFAKEFFDEFRDRLLFGRDCFSGDLQSFIDSLNLSDEILDKIYAENAERLIKEYK
jgi:predicted TIM-barrel fold metal-dependent hydrolase